MSEYDLGNDDSKRLARLRDFAHEVRTPLNAIVGYTSMMTNAKDRGLDIDTMSEYGATVNEAAMRLVRICERVLEEEISGEPIIRKEKVDFSVMAEALMREFGPLAAERGLTMNVNIAENFPVLITDPLLLNQALTNLLNNALKFTPKGGKVDLIGKLDLQSKAVILVVQDDGRGIAPGLMKRLMAGDKVTTSEPAGFTNDKGWGRGIQIVRDLADRLGATLSIESEEGRGTIVSIRIDIEATLSPD